jgi:hypothetical protein
MSATDWRTSAGFAPPAASGLFRMAVCPGPGTRRTYCGLFFQVLALKIRAYTGRRENDYICQFFFIKSVIGQVNLATNERKLISC